tara:strand:- start:12398 stop:12811 length:414 start_codon:yes stop_codon:yes gene_type:complete
MNYLNSVLLFSFIVIIFGCGTDGSDGDTFLRFRSVLMPTEFSIDNPDIPEDFEYDRYYKVSPGRYYFTYIDHNGLAHPQVGEFDYVDIESSPGSKGSLFRSGEPGADLYKDLILLSSGPVIENFDYYTVVSTLNYSP